MKSALAHFQTLPLKDAARQLLTKLGYLRTYFPALPLLQPSCLISPIL